MEGVTFVALPAWAAGALGILFAAFVAWAIHDRQKIGEVLGRIRERLARIEAKIEKTIKGGDE